jgi:hypothetical protein
MYPHTNKHEPADKTIILHTTDKVGLSIGYYNTVSTTEVIYLQMDEDDDRK